MSISHLLEDFGTYGSGNPIAMSDVTLEEQKLEAFEKGYRAGWDDSVKAQMEDAKRVTTDLAQNLHELSFTYQEAYAAVLKSLNPLLQQMVETVLPAAVRHTLGTRLSDLLQDLAAEHGKQAVELVASPANKTALEQMIDQDSAMPMTVTEEPTLGDGQVYIRFGELEREVNLTEVLSEIERSVAGFFEENQKEIA